MVTEFRRVLFRSAGVAPEMASRTDCVRALTFGAGCRFGSDKRIGFAIERQRRTSSVDGRQYRGLRFGVSLTYET